MKTKEQEATKESTGNVIDSDFIPLEDLVYAPLYALAKSNQQLKSNIIESIKSMGKAEHTNKEEIIHLDHMNIAYDQVKQDEEGYSVDNLQLEVPLLSIIPMNQLNVDKAEIDFSTEVKAVVDKENQKTQIQARICSPSQRESDFLPKVSYKLQVQSLPATEGILRLIDSLSSSQVAKKLNTRPVAVTGDWGSEEQKRVLNETKKLKAKMNRLKQLYQKINDMIAEQEKLSQISTDCFVEDTYEFDKDKYLMAQSNIVNRIMEYQEKVMNLEIKFGLDHDYE
ncbi:MAG: DUF2589 domain-containing protein [Anaeroplasmataceae bacterium]|nr:DUF2589 domain-containing protein [Anaeroplasmataceae bacterium]